MRYFRHKLGKIIFKHRKHLKMSQEDLAAYTGLHRTYISEVELGKRNISIDNLLKISVSLKISLSNLIREAEHING